MYVYDNGGNIMSVKEYAYTTRTLGAATRTAYYYVYNLQGDVIGILSSGVYAAKYSCDAWGKLLSVKDASGKVITDRSYWIDGISPCICARMMSSK